jgi:WS/DGAT/MGAT family acyltransferase
VIEGLHKVEGVPAGAFAIYIKIHHAVVDGMAAVQLITALHSKSPDSTAATLPAPLIVDRVPPVPELAVATTRNALGRAGRAAGLLLQSGSRVIGAWRDSSDAAGLPLAAPKTRFSAKVSPHRVLEGFPLPIAGIKSVRDKLPGITLNDVFLSVASGAVRRYLDGKGELPAASLNALMPISLRSDASAGGNEVAGVPVALHTEIADPLERLQAVHAAAEAAKEGAERLGLDFLKNLFEVLPGFATNLIVRKTMLPRINLTVSNVRGPTEPIFMAGARVVALCPASIAADGVGLNLTAVSYDGVLWVSVVSCRDMLPDPAHFVTCLRAEWEGLVAAVDSLPTPKTASRKRTSAVKESIAASAKPVRKPAGKTKAASKTKATGKQ